MKICVNPAVGEWDALMSRKLADDDKVKDAVRAIVDRVVRDGDRALLELAEEIDGVSGCGIEVTAEDFAAAQAAVSEEMKEALETAADNIWKFHAAQLPGDVEVETAPGVRCIQRPVPLQKVGLYVPGGSAPLFSTVLMLGVPARVAGCVEVVLCTPPRKDGSVAPEVLYAASLCGIKRIFKVGGAQAIAAMAYGTETIPAVDKIFGPGNRYVMAAKQLVGATQVSIDMPAGPSEVMVMADGTARHDFVAADLLSQAEHGPDSQAVLLCLSADFADSVRAEVMRQAELLPRREITLRALDNSRLIVLDSVDTMIEFANRYAAEHLILSVANPWGVAERITAAGSIFIGNYSPESAGDYASGTNHTLPTSGWAKSCSGVNTDSFFRKITIQELTPSGLQGLGDTIMTMARGEGLDAHRRAVEVRLGALATEFSRAASSLSSPAGAAGIAAQTADSVADRSYDREAAERRVWRLMRENIRTMAPYSTARDEFDGIPEICLDANENPFNNGFNRYPDPHQKALKATISRLKSVPTDRIFIGNGSDEAIDLVYRVFCRPGVDNAVAIAPTYGMYRVAAETNDIVYREVQLREDFSLDDEALFAAMDSRTKLIFICSPNNPTGNSFPKEQIESIIRRFHGIVVLDEAYIDFSAGEGFLGELDSFPNLVILQTMSKARGMAGLRVGMAFASPLIIGAFSNVKYPYNINELTQKIVRQRLEDAMATAAATAQSGASDTPQSAAGTIPGVTANPQVETIVAERRRLEQELETCPLVLRVYPSDANFLLVKVTQAKKIYEALVAEGVIVRDRSRVRGCEGCLRITVGTRRENDRLLHLLSRLASDSNFAAAETTAPADNASSAASDASFPTGSCEASGLSVAASAAPVTPAQSDVPTADPPLASAQSTAPASVQPASRAAASAASAQPTASTARPAAQSTVLDSAHPASSIPAATTSLASAPARSATVFRATNETQITVMLDLDGAGPSYISTGIGFFDHMLDQLVHHGGISLLVEAKGDLQVDEHHTIEDVGIALGETLCKALGNKAGIGRYGFVLPMDESEAKVLIDLGGRIDFKWDVTFTREKIGDMPTEMFSHFFKSFAESARCNLHISATGENEHHKIEGVFKAFARALRAAVARTGAANELPSSKGVL